MKKQRKPNLIFVIFALILAIWSIRYYFSHHFFTFNDETQIVNLDQYYKAMDLGQFPPRWATNMVFNYGSPFLQFNYQLPYYLGYLAHLYGANLVFSFKWIMVVSALIASLSMYSLSRLYLSPALSLIPTIMYIFTPYRAIIFYVRGTIGEAVAFSLLPLVVLGLVKLYQSFTTKNLLISTIAISLLILAHQPTSLIFLPIIYLVFIVQLLFQRRYPPLFHILLPSLSSLLLTAYYWLPLLFEKQYIQVSSPFNYFDHFPFLKQLIFSPWGYGGSNWGPFDGISFQIGLLNLAIVVLAAILLFSHKISSNAKISIAAILLGFGISVYLMNIRSNWFWLTFKPLIEIQFPWRFLIVTTFLTSYLTIFILKTTTNFPRIIISLTIMTFSLISSFSYFHPVGWFDHDDNYFLRRFLPTSALQTGELVSPEYLNHTEDYVSLPLAAVRPKNLPISKITSIRKTEQEIISTNPLDYRTKIVTDHPDTLTFHTFYFPGWQASINGQPAAITVNDAGAITVEIPHPGKYEVHFFYTNTPLRQFADKISFFSFILLITSLSVTLSPWSKKIGLAT